MNHLTNFLKSNKFYYFGAFVFSLIILGKGKIFTDAFTTVILILLILGLFINIFFTLKNKLYE